MNNRNPLENDSVRCDKPCGVSAPNAGTPLAGEEQFQAADAATDRLRQLTLSVASGSYRVRSVDLADKLIRDMLRRGRLDRRHD